MSRHGKRDILIHFDEEKNEIVLYSVSVNDTESIRETEFDGARLDVSSFLKMSADDAEKEVGHTIFSIIDTFSFRKIGIRPYEDLSKERHREDVSYWEIEAGKGDPEAQHLLFLEYHSQALSNCDADALKKAEQMLEASAAQGYPNAIASKEHWPLVRAAAERKLKRGPAA